jgi:hypothetical protein
MRPSPLERLLLLWRLFEPPNLPELPRRNCFLRAFAGDDSTATGGESAGTRISRSSKGCSRCQPLPWLAPVAPAGQPGPGWRGPISGGCGLATGS